MPIQIVSASSDSLQSTTLLADLNESLNDLRHAPADLLLCYYNADIDQHVLVQHLRPLAGSIIGASSCQGALCVNRDANQAQASAVVFALSDADGDYGVGSCALADDAFAAGETAIEQALQQAGRENECPELIWCVLPPGNEEEVMRGIASVVGEHVPIVGGSSADNAVEGRWSQLCGGEVVSDTVVLAVLFPSVEISHSFSSGYLPSQSKGVVTECEQRRLISIDNLPAAAYYNNWIDGVITAQLSGGSVLGETTLYPVARVVDKVDGIEQFVLTHPESVSESGELMLFSQLEVGDEIVLMQGSTQSLVERASAVLANAIALLPSDAEVAGAMMVYCAGCMLTVGEQIQDVADSLLSEEFGFPVVGTYTFGEQGCFLDGQSRHGNLMISALVFANA